MVSYGSMTPYISTIGDTASLSSSILSVSAGRVLNHDAVKGTDSFLLGQDCVTGDIGHYSCDDLFDQTTIFGRQYVVYIAYIVLHTC